MAMYSISQEICTRFLLCCALLWLYIDWFSHNPSGLLHWHCGNLTIAPVPAKQPWWIWINTSCEFIVNDCITTTKQSTTKPCAYFLGYTVYWHKLASLSFDELTYWDKMAVISKTKSRNTFCWMKMFEFRLIFHWILFLMVQLTIRHHCFR